MRVILGILKCDTGKVIFKGKDITGHRPWEIVESGIAGTFQVVKPFRHLPVIMNVMVACLSPGTKKGSGRNE